ncbi:MAG TPA: hypothetical protein VF533_09280 [Solirubrobacteraceae bacterium]|jgi:hypothetical protein
MIGAVIALAGCGGDGRAAREPAKAPAGFATAAGDRWSFAYPRDWQRIDVEAERGEEIAGFQSPPGANGLASQVGIGVKDGARDELAVAVRLAKDQSRIVYPGYEILAERAVDVGGAEAHRIDARYDSFQDEPAEVRTADLLVRTPDGLQLNLFVRGPAADFDRLGLARILDTLRVR